MIRSVWVSMMFNPFSAMASALACPQHLRSSGMTSPRITATIPSERAHAVRCFLRPKRINYVQM